MPFAHDLTRCSAALQMTAAVAVPSYVAQRAADAIRYRHQISAAARPALYRPTVLNRGQVHSALVYHAPALAYLSPSTASFASCWATRMLLLD